MFYKVQVHLAQAPATHCLLELVMLPPVNLSVTVVQYIPNIQSIPLTTYTLHDMLQARRRFIYKAALRHRPCQIGRQARGLNSSSSCDIASVQIYAPAAVFKRVFVSKPTERYSHHAIERTHLRCHLLTLMKMLACLDINSFPSSNR